MDNKKECKGCSATVRQSFEEINKQMDEYVKTIPLDDCVEDDEYKKRLQACKDCLALYYESTCKYCGCFVRMRAKRKNKSCPYPGQDKWK